MMAETLAERVTKEGWIKLSASHESILEEEVITISCALGQPVGGRGGTVVEVLSVRPKTS